MSEPVFAKTLEKERVIEKNQDFRLEVSVKDPDDVHFVWQKGQTPYQEQVGVDGQTFQKAEATPEDAGTYTVTAWRGAGGSKSKEISGGKCVVTLKPEPVTDRGRPLEWDEKFARNALILAGSAAIVMLLVIGGFASATASIAWTVSVGLLTLAAVLAAGGIAVALIDLRGRASAASVAAGGGRGFGEDAVKSAADILKAWGSLGLASAMMALVAIAIISAAVLGWRSLPDPSAASSSGSPTVSATASAASSSSATLEPAPSGTP